MAQHQSSHQKAESQGISLVEMLIGLVIIGGLLGIVMVGIDLQRNAENKRIAQLYIGGWAKAYNHYYERMGIVPGDQKNQRSGLTNLPLSASFAELFSQAGVPIPVTQQGQPVNRYHYFDDQGNPHQLHIAFEAITVPSPEVGVGLLGNVMRLEQVSPRLFATLEAQVDDQPSPSGGELRCLSTLNMAEDNPMRLRNKNKAHHSFVCWYKMRF
ncbi:type II secretion system protein [Magnetococcus sp. PR-3]|uniref:type II secretion system protein n=1 Tax=Magnetococcus sp. PR-3 TaxID=3120355 RepID=UPI002FCE2A48